MASVHGARPSTIRDQGFVDEVQNRRVYLWDLDAAGVPSPRFLNVPEGSPRSVVFSPNGRFVVAGADRNIYVWQIDGKPQPEPSFELSRPDDPATADRWDIGPMELAFSPDGNTLVAAWSNGVVGFWSYPSGPSDKPVFRKQGWLGSTPRRTLIEFSSDGRFVAVASARAVGDSAFSRGIEQSLSGLFGTATADEQPAAEIACWKLDGSKPAEKPVVVKLPNDTLKCVAFSNKSDRLAAGDGEKDIRLWQVGDDGPIIDGDAGKPVEIEHTNDAFGASGIEDLVFWPDDRWLISVGASDSRFWDLGDLKPGAAAEAPLPTFVLPGGDRVLFNAENLWMTTAASERGTVLWHDLFIRAAPRLPDVQAEDEFGQMTIYSGQVGERTLVRIG
jgi:WD40 repeat protein